METLEGKIGSFEKELKTQKLHFATERTTLLQDVHDLKKSNSSLEKSNSSLRQSIGDLKKDNHDLRKTVQILEKDNHDLKTVPILEKDNRNPKKDNHDLKNWERKSKILKGRFARLRNC